MKRYILILSLITLSLTGLSSCYVENEAYPDTYYMGHGHLRHRHVTGDHWHNHMGGGYHGGLNNEQRGAHPRHGNGSGDLDR